MNGLKRLLFLTFTICTLQNAEATSNSFISTCLGSREGDPASLVENVSTIHGDYTEIEVDLTVPAPDALILSRFYSSRDTTEIATFGGWRFNPHCFLAIRKDPKGKPYTSAEGKFERAYVCVGNPDGTILNYVGWQNTTNPSKRVLFKIDPEGETEGLANTAKGNINCWTNLKNNELYFNPQTNSFELLLCSEGKRFYAKHPSLDLYVITYEILPSGNKVFYEFDEKGQLSFIKETNASEKKILAWIKIQFGNGVHVETSDGKTADYYFENSSGYPLLTEVNRSNKPNLRYAYRVVGNHALMFRKSLPEGRDIEVEYYTDKANQNKVRSVTIPSNAGEAANLHFFYEDNYTEVSGPGSRKILYRFDDNLQLVGVEEFLDGSPYRIYKKSWGTKSDASHLVSTSIEAANGKVFYYKQLTYDKAGGGNLVEEREYGDLAGASASSLVIDEDGSVANQHGHIKNYSYFSGKTTHGFFQKDAQGAGVKYWYKKGTNLLHKKFVIKKGSDGKEEEDDSSGIKERHFYTYNEDAALIQVLLDDGRSSSPQVYDDQYTVHERMITYITPKQELPNVGAPEIIEQKYRSLDRKSEILLKRTVNEFDAQGNIISQAYYDANEKHCYTTIKRYENGLLIFETDPIGNEKLYSYDQNRNLVSEKHSNSGISIEYGYDLRNRLIYSFQQDMSGKRFESQVSYDSAGYKIAEIDRFGNETLYVNDDLGRPIYVTYPEISNGFHSSVKPTYTYVYDLFDNAVSVTDPSGKTLIKSYNIYGKPTEIQHLDGTKEIFRYDAGTNLRYYYGRDGILQKFSYDDRGRIDTIQYYNRKNKNSEQTFKSKYYRYNAFHKEYETDGDGDTTDYTYDGAGRLVTLKKGDQKVDFIYDSQGRIHGVKKWKSSDSFTLQVKEYDILDRVIEERTEDTQGHPLVKKRYVYDTAGRLAEVIGYPQNKERVLMRYEYDGFGRLSKTITAAGYETHVAYEGNYVSEWGQKSLKRSITDPLGNQTEEILDTDGNLIKITKKDKNGHLLAESEFAYDSSGNSLLERAVVVSDGAQSRAYEVERSFNSANQLQSITLGKNAAQERTLQFEYNSYGELSSVLKTDSQKPISYNYDLIGNLETVSYNDGKQETNFNLSYDSRRNLKSIRVRSSFSIDYSFNINNLLLSEKIQDEFGGYSVSYSYDGEGKIELLELPDGSYIKYAYEGPFVKNAKRFSKDGKELYSYQVASRDQMGNLLEEILPGNLGARKQIWDEAGRRIEISTDFFQDKVGEDGYDPLDNLTKREITWDDETTLADYNYNALSQLMSEKGEIEHTYSYDSIDNRMKKDGSLYKVDELNQLIAAEGVTYTFDSSGNLATKTIGNRTWIYQSNPLNQIISITDPDQNVVKFTYDLTGKRLAKRIELKGKKPKVFRFFYLGETEIGSLDEKGTIVELKVPSDPNNPEAHCVAIEIKKETYVPLYDLQGNIVCLLDHQRRKVIESYRHSVYGEEEIINQKGNIVSDSSVGNPWRYRGKRVDKEISLIYFGHRYYSPETGRWVSQDPLGTIDGPNLYAYARNNPMKYVDYFGLTSDINENQSCVCGHCVRGEGFCHCLLGIDHPECVCKGIFCEHKRARSIISSDSQTLNRLGGALLGIAKFGVSRIQGMVQSYGAGAMEDFISEMELDRDIILSAVENEWAQLENKGRDVVIAAIDFDPSSSLALSWQTGAYRTSQVIDFFCGNIKNPKRIFSLNKPQPTKWDVNIFSKAGQELDRAGLTKAGRALSKHGNREGSIFPKATGNVDSKNMQGQFHLDDIVTHPQSITSANRFGGIDIFSPDGRGARFNTDSKFMGFLQPRRE